MMGKRRETAEEKARRTLGYKSVTRRGALRSLKGKGVRVVRPELYDLETVERAGGRHVRVMRKRPSDVARERDEAKTQTEIAQRDADTHLRLSNSYHKILVDITGHVVGTPPVAPPTDRFLRMLPDAVEAALSSARKERSDANSRAVAVQRENDGLRAQIERSREIAQLMLRAPNATPASIGIEVPTVDTRSPEERKSAAVDRIVKAWTAVGAVRFGALISGPGMLPNADTLEDDDLVARIEAFASAFPTQASAAPTPIDRAATPADKRLFGEILFRAWERVPGYRLSYVLYRLVFDLYDLFTAEDAQIATWLRNAVLDKPDLARRHVPR
ncbi:MAG: hypothetical protein ACHREM_02285 [Polyangiales bacterium]